MYPTVSFISQSSHIHPVPVQRPSKIKHTHTKQTTIKTKDRVKQLIVEAVVRHSVSHRSLANVHGSESLIWFEISVTLSILDPHQNSSWLYLCCPTSWRSCSSGAWELALSRVPNICRWYWFGTRPISHFCNEIVFEHFDYKRATCISEQWKALRIPLSPQPK